MLIQCPECKQKISEDAQTCPHCGKPITDELHEQAVAKATKDAKAGQIGCAIAALLPIVLVLWLFAPRETSQDPRPTRVPTPSGVSRFDPRPSAADRTPRGPELRIGGKDWNWHREADMFVMAEGTVTNISSRSLEHVEAVVEFSSSDGTFISSQSALIEYQPILPGQSSPWKVLGTWNPAMQSGKAKLSFKHLMGGAISTEISD